MALGCLSRDVPHHPCSMKQSTPAVCYSLVWVWIWDQVLSSARYVLLEDKLRPARHTAVSLIFLTIHLLNRRTIQSVNDINRSHFTFTEKIVLQKKHLTGNFHESTALWWEVTEQHVMGEREFQFLWFLVK